MNSLDFLSEVRHQLRAEAYKNLPEVARLSGVPESTLKKIRSGEVKDPRVSTVQALLSYFARKGSPLETNAEELLMPNTPDPTQDTTPDGLIPIGPTNVITKGGAHA